MAVMQTYDLKGKKLSFANWISNLSPTETPFVSMTSKEAVTETKYYWQTDSLALSREHHVVEGSDVHDSEYIMQDPTLKFNYTQILRKVVQVTDTANLIAAYGRGREVAYQLEKAGHAIKRDLETIFLKYDQAAVEGNGSTARKTATFGKLVAPKGNVQYTTGAIVHFETVTANKVTLGDVNKMTYNLFLANSKANIIMFHPKYASMFAAFSETDGNARLFDGESDTFAYYVNTFVDEFGREYKLVPNRFMPEDALYFFNSSDFTQMVLRAPQRIKLAKEGAYESWMIEMEVGLRLDNPYSAGILKVKA